MTLHTVSTQIPLPTSHALAKSVRAMRGQSLRSAKVMRALRESVRLEILLLISNRELSDAHALGMHVNELQPIMELATSTVKRHLHILLNAHLIAAHGFYRQRTYTLHPETSALVKVILIPLESKFLMKGPTAIHAFKATP